MADPITWYALGRLVNDPETILEAVDAKILTHNFDPSAHGQSNEAIYNHRIAELLDHVYGSVKLAHLGADHVQAMTCFESLDGWNTAGTVGAGILGAAIQTPGGGSNSEGYIYAHHRYYVGWTPDKNPFFQATVYILSSTSQEGHVILGSLIDGGLNDMFGFKWVNNTLYAYWIKSETEYTQELTGVNAIGLHCFRAYIDSTAGEMYFYVDGVLKHTESTNVPVDGGQYLAEFYIYSSTSAVRIIYPIDWLFQMDR